MQNPTVQEVFDAASRIAFGNSRIQNNLRAIVVEAIVDIAARSGYWHEGITWTEKVGRHAHIYIFAVHPVEDDMADHRDPSQWRFYVVETSQLPPLPQKSIGLASVKVKGKEVDWQGLLIAVEDVRKRLASQS